MLGVAIKKNSIGELYDKDFNEEVNAKVNEESTVNEESGVMLNAKEEAPEVSIRESNEVELNVAHNEVKEEMSKGKPLEVKRRGSFAAKSEVRTSWEPGESDAAMFDEVKSEVKSDVNVEAKVEVFGMKEVMIVEDNKKVEVDEKFEEVVMVKPPEVLQRFDLAAKVQVEEFGTKEVMQIDDLKIKEVSRHANLDPGEPVDAKAQTEMSDAKEEKILVNNGKVGLSRDVNWKVFYYAMALNNVVLFNTEASLIVLFLLRFVNRCRSHCLIELSDYG